MKENNHLIVTNNKKYALNQILYGVPGTGKTYATVQISLQILGADTHARTRADLKNEFDERMKAAQIQFVTFHQSMTYEDFVEGIKPKMIDGKITYEIKNGIFKDLCQQAAEEFKNFELGFKNLLKAIKTPKNIVETTTSAGKKMVFSKKSDEFILRFNGNETVHKDHIGSFLQRNDDSYKTPELEAVIKLLKNYSYPKPYVLIIDEINRGNVAQIFGELITLIEADKRLGQDEQLKVTLPYSKTIFGIPDNIFIIGTMNSADRSVEALDSALRRRFEFRECPPQYNDLKMVENYDLKAILKAINARIEQLLDRDHVIGHTYFLNIQNLEELKMVFQQQIMPLLQEYFFHDYGKIGLILGGGFVEKLETENESIFANFDYEKPENHPIYRIKTDIDIKTALEKLLQNG
jgi:5-methylcytosine-specific restriction protein B